jgi:hypothetical protein
MTGEKIELRAVGFNPKPQVVSVEISYAGRDRLTMSNRVLIGDRFIVHPKIPLIAKPFIKVPDTQIWLTDPPIGFLRSEGPLAEPGDAVIRIDGLPGGQSGSATSIRPAARR